MSMPILIQELFVVISKNPTKKQVYKCIYKLRNLIKIRERINSKTREKGKFVKCILIIWHDICKTSLSMAEQKRIGIIIVSSPQLIVVRNMENVFLWAENLGNYLMGVDS